MSNDDLRRVATIEIHRATRNIQSSLTRRGFFTAPLQGLKALATLITSLRDATYLVVASTEFHLPAREAGDRCRRRGDALKNSRNPAKTSDMKNLLISVAMLLLSIPALSQQQADLTFDASVKNPAYTTTHPKVLFDEAHFNFHTAGGRYKPFADLITNDGYRVIANKEKFAAQSLNGADVLVIANAGAAEAGSADRRKPAFTDAECDAVREWVRAGGALLLIADHAPAGSAAANLSATFGVDMSKGFTADPVNYERVALDTSWIRFSRVNRNLGDHPITRGRDATERINSVLSFTGQSLKGPKESTALLKLSRGAYDVDDLNHPDKAKMTSSAGRAQSVALSFGKGRVVVFGEAAMLTAQNQNFGMNYPGTDNRQLVLNVMHWLTGLLN
jgi:hypothetical protein